MRHIDVRGLWLQQEVAEGRVRVIKVQGKSNPADLLAKILSRPEIEEILKMMNQRIEWNEVGNGWQREGRSIS